MVSGEGHLRCGPGYAIACRCEGRCGGGVRVLPGVEPVWLNDGPLIARPLGLEPHDPLVVYSGKNLTVSVAGARFVLAMKVVAGRDTDGRDLPYLFDAAGVDSLDAVVALHQEAYRGLPLHANADRTLREAGPRAVTPGPQLEKGHRTRPHGGAATALVVPTNAHRFGL